MVVGLKGATIAAIAIRPAAAACRKAVRCQSLVTGIRRLGMRIRKRYRVGGSFNLG